MALFVRRSLAFRSSALAWKRCSSSQPVMPGCDFQPTPYTVIVIMLVLTGSGMCCRVITISEQTCGKFRR